MAKKICVLTTSYPLGNRDLNGFPPGKFVHDMAKNLVTSGFEVHVVTHHSDNTKKHELIDGVNVHRFHYFLPFAETLTRGSGMPENIKKHKNKLLVPFYFLGLALFSWRIIRKYNIDLINAHWVVPTGYIAVWLKKITKKKLIVTMYGAELFPVLQGKMKFLHFYIKKTLENADIIAGISHATVDAAKTFTLKKDFKLIPDGIDINYYKIGIKNSNLLAKYNCQPSDKVVFFTGRMVERKGHRFIIEAIDIVKNEVPNVKVILGGRGVLWDELVKLRSNLYLTNYIEMPGFIDEQDLVPLLQSSDLFVLPSCIDNNGDTEGSATAAFEAMACGTPAIISSVGGNVGAINENEGAYYFENSNSKDLASKIILLLTDKDVYDKNKKLARDFIVSNYSWDSSIQKYIDAINLLN